MKAKDIFVISFMLFAMFFGAGNLIFPVSVGFQSSVNFKSAIIGFIITGVGLPVLGMIVGSVSEGGYRNVMNYIHPIFSIVFLSLVYLTIGPFFALPRTGTTSYEMMVAPIIGGPTDMSLFIFTIFFYMITLWIALNPSKIADTVGKYLTPMLLATIILLVGFLLVKYGSNAPSIDTMTEQFQTAPLGTGFKKGYLTMDTLATLAFSVVVVSVFKQKGVTDRNLVFKYSSISAVIAATLLAVIYGFLAWTGNHSPVPPGEIGNQNMGTYLLNQGALDAFGPFGVYLLGTIVFLACLTTSSGLVTAVGQFFHDLYPKISYKTYAIGITLIAFVLANQGLDQVISMSVPVLGILYPTSIAIILMVLLSRWIPIHQLNFRLMIGAVLLESLLSTIHSLNIIEINFVESLPLYHISLEWIPVLLISYLIGFLIPKKTQTIDFTKNHFPKEDSQFDKNARVDLAD